MRTISLIFPDNVAMSEFVVKQKLHHAEVYSGEQMLTAELTDEQIDIARTDYDAIPVRLKQPPNSSASSALWL